MLMQLDAYERMQRNLVQDFANIQWYARPEGPVQCRNAEYWCHTCGYGYCLSCRQTGEACNHDPCNFSSEINEAFLPESIGTPGSSIDLAELVQETIDQFAYFELFLAALEMHNPTTGEKHSMTCYGGPKKERMYTATLTSRLFFEKVFQIFLLPIS